MRGDDPSSRVLAWHAVGVSPACAGMILIYGELDRRHVGEPRMRGDDPFNGGWKSWGNK